MTEAPGPVGDRAATVQLLGVLSLVLLPFCGLGVPVAVMTLVMARAERRARLVAGAPPLPRVGPVCAAIALSIAGFVVVAALAGLALLLAGASAAST